MQALARRFDEDQDRWALAGLFHDLDQDQTREDLSRHAYLAAEWLREAGVEEPVVNAVLAHAHEQYRTDLMARTDRRLVFLSGGMARSRPSANHRGAGCRPRWPDPCLAAHHWVIGSARWRVRRPLRL